jgi:hypothetical protein
MANAEKTVKAAKAATVEKEHWASEPEAHDFPAAAVYLSLLLGPGLVEAVVDELRRAPTIRHRANDLLRASALALLPADDPSVVRDLKKVKQGSRLSPVLLVRGVLAAGRHLTIADGYHRICASYHLDEDAAIPCRLADLPLPTTPAGAQPSS